MNARDENWARPAAVASFLLALVASGVILFAPIQSETRSSGVTPPVENGTPAAPQENKVSLLAQDGWRDAVPLSIPSVVAAAGAALSGTLRRRAVAIAATALLVAWVLVTSASVGLVFAPSAIAMAVAAAGQHRTAALT